MIDERYAKRKYHAHKGVAKQRNIPFELSYQDWITIWISSGHWEDRGARKGCYCMSRNNDTGPYAIGNVFIQLFEKNYSDAVKGKKKSKEHIENWRNSWYKNKNANTNFLKEK